MFIAEFLGRPSHGHKGVIHHGCDCLTDITSMGKYETFTEAVRRLNQLGIDRPDLCPTSFPAGKPVFHSTTGVLVGHVRDDKFTPAV